MSWVDITANGSGHTAGSKRNAMYATRTFEYSNLKDPPEFLHGRQSQFDEMKTNAEHDSIPKTIWSFVLSRYSVHAIRSCIVGQTLMTALRKLCL